MKKRGRPSLENAARHTLSFRARPTEVERLEALIAQTGETQGQVLRDAIAEFLDRKCLNGKTPTP